MNDKNQVVRHQDQMPAAPDDSIRTTRMPFGLRVYFDDELFNRVKVIAQYMSRAVGITPPHLLGKEESCFSVVTNSISWNLVPDHVARSTYQTPEGKIGYEGKLVAAILIKSGQLVGGLNYEMIGDWSKVQNRFTMEKSEKGRPYPKKAYTDKDEVGLGVIVSAQVRGEDERRTLTFMMTQAYPRFSTLWATDPVTQIKYTATRRFASIAVPELIFGIPFDRELDEFVPAGAIDVTPVRQLTPGLDAVEPTMKSMRETSRRVPRRDPDPEPETDHGDVGAAGQGGDDGPYELFDEVGELMSALETPQDHLRAFLERAGKIVVPLDREHYLDNNKGEVLRAIETLGMHPLATQAQEYYPLENEPAPASPPIPAIEKDENGRANIMAWQNEINVTLTRINHLPTLGAYADAVIKQGTAAKFPRGAINSVNLAIARRKGEIEKG